MTILITGGSGFIGSNFIIEWLNYNDQSIVNFDNLTYAGNSENLYKIQKKEKYNFIKGDIINPKEIDDAILRVKPSAIIHFAAETHVDRSIDKPARFVETNILGTFQLLNSALSYWKSLSKIRKNNFRFIHISTDEVYGSLKLNDPPFTESTKYSPNSPYSASKASSDHLVQSYFKTYGFPAIITNCSNNYGPYQFPEKLIPLIINNALQEKTLPVYGDGLQIRDWLYVHDHCSAIRCVLSKGRPGEVYNIGGKNERTNIDIVRQICEQLNVKRPRSSGECYEKLISHVQDRPGHDRRYAIDNSKIEYELGWYPIESFETGLSKTINWYLSNLRWIANVINRNDRII